MTKQLTMEKILAIDLGTINSSMAVSIGGQPTVIANLKGQRVTPSVVAYDFNGDRLVGQSAKQQKIINPQNTFYSVNYFVGNKYEEINNKIEEVSYHVVSDRSGKVKIQCPIFNQQFVPEEILAQILGKLADDTSFHLKEQLTETIITVPTYFDDTQRQAVRDAARIAGLKVVRILSESYAASLAYDCDNETILLFDFGSRLKVSLINTKDSVAEVKFAVEDIYTGSQDFDRKIINWLAEEFERDEGIDLRQDTQALQRLVEASEIAKIKLSLVEQTQIYLPFIINTENGVKHVNKILKRSHFEHLCSDILARCHFTLGKFLEGIELNNLNINKVILGGGSTCIPIVQSLVQSVTNKSINCNINPNEVFAIGAAKLFPNGITNDFPISLIHDEVDRKTKFAE